MDLKLAVLVNHEKAEVFQFSKLDAGTRYQPAIVYTNRRVGRSALDCFVTAIGQCTIKSIFECIA